MSKRLEIAYTTPTSYEYNPKGSPERNLLMAMLERAILDYVGNNSSEINAAKDWIFSKDKEEYSFIWLCMELDLDPDSIAKIIKNMPKRGSKRTAPWYQARQAARQKAA